MVGSRAMKHRAAEKYFTNDENELSTLVDLNKAVSTYQMTGYSKDIHQLICVSIARNTASSAICFYCMFSL